MLWGRPLESLPSIFIATPNPRRNSLGTQIFFIQQRRPTIWISSNTWSAYLQFGTEEKIMDCPDLTYPFGINYPATPRYEPPDGFMVGYNYLGGHWDWWTTNAGWISPQKNTEQGTLPLLADYNHWSQIAGYSVAPHTSHSARVLAPGTSPLGGLSSRQIGADGGNVGYLDGCVNWKRPSQ